MENLGWMYSLLRNLFVMLIWCVIDFVCSFLYLIGIHRQTEPNTIGNVFRAAPDPCVHFQKPKR